ncbi:MAG: hypothetical protein KIT81_03985 [Alphaproteobacteria bacterium]|nr:hypothetical protein [Alphaproteobacteria bacterium]
MISIEDCLALCELSEEEVAAIAEHEHIPEIEAAALGQYLVHQPDGPPKIRRFIIEDIQQARARGDLVHVLALRRALSNFLQAHPRNR